MHKRVRGFSMSYNKSLINVYCCSSLFTKPDKKKEKRELYSIKHMEQKLCTNEWRVHNQICACKGLQKQDTLDFKPCGNNECWDDKNSIVLLKLPNAAEAANFVENLRVNH